LRSDTKFDIRCAPQVLSLVLNDTELLAEVRKGAAYNRNNMHRVTLTLVLVQVCVHSGHSVWCLARLGN
jgi:hypothetical protein